LLQNVALLVIRKRQNYPKWTNVLVMSPACFVVFAYFKVGGLHHRGWACLDPAVRWWTISQSLVSLSVCVVCGFILVTVNSRHVVSAQ